MATRIVRFPKTSSLTCGTVREGWNGGAPLSRWATQWLDADSLETVVAGKPCRFPHCPRGDRSTELYRFHIWGTLFSLGKR
jgi:hypothetical protein